MGTHWTSSPARQAPTGVSAHLCWPASGTQLTGMDGSGTGLDLGLLGSLGPTGEMELSVPVIEAPNIDLDMDHGQIHNLEPAPVQVAEILVDGKIHLVEIQAADVVMEDSVMLEDR